MSDRSIVAVRSGRLKGRHEAGVLRFGGIPYANRIDGAGRLRLPRPVPHWTGLRDATGLAPRVPQVVDAGEVANQALHRELFGSFHDAPMSEDGLFLNLWAPEPRKGANLPVMVWLHGGGFAVGGPTRPREDGSSLAARGVVVVSPNHRLGAMGYALLAKANDGVANIGMLDIVAALRWVRDNISAFGGDPDRVTVFGESGGAMKTTALLAMPQAMGLFHRAIAHGGVLDEDVHLGLLDHEGATEETDRFLRALGADPGDPRPRIEAATADEIVAADQASGGGLMRWRPVLDPVSLPQSVLEATRTGRLSNVPLIIGCAAHEMEFFAADEAFRPAKDIAELSALVGPSAPQLANSYAGFVPAGQDPIRRVCEDRMFRIPSIRMAEARDRAGLATWRYIMDYVRSNDPAPRSTHGSETGFAFGTTEMSPRTSGDPDARMLSDIVQSAWMAFAANGAPHTPHLAWPRYRETERAVAIFSITPLIADDPDALERKAWGLASSSGATGRSRACTG